MAFKVLLCSPLGRMGGICQWTDNVLKYNNENKEDKFFLDWYYCKLSKKPPQINVNLFSRILDGFKTYVPFLKGLKEKLSKGDYDAVHFSTSGNISFIRDYFALKMCRKRYVKTVLHLHFGSLSEMLVSNAFLSFIFRRCIPFVSAFIVMDRKTERTLKELGCRNVHFIANPLSESVSKLINSSDSVEREENVVLYVGQLLQTKGVIELVNACRDIEGVRLVLMGPYAEDIKNKILNCAGENNYKWLSITGACSMDKVIAAMKKCSVFVLPSYSEGFPNVIIESMASGAPIIATPVGAIPEMLGDGQDKAGILVPVKETFALKNAIRELLSDKQLARELGNRARRIAEDKFSIHKVWQELCRVWLN